MAKFIEVHRIPMSSGEPFPQILNLDDVSVACGSTAGTTIALRRTPDLMGNNVFQIAETGAFPCPGTQKFHSLSNSGQTVEFLFSTAPPRRS